MWVYQKRLQYPIKIRSTNPALAKIIATQYGGPHGEIGASLRYLSQRYVMPYPELKAILNDIGTEELAHLEMVGTIVYQLTRNLTPEQIKKAGYDAYFVDHTTGIYPVSAAGDPFSAMTIDSTGDTLADIHEDLAAEQKARMTYDNILRFCTDEPDVRDAIRFLRAREVVHYQRFGEGLRIITDNLDDRNFYAFNPAFDKNRGNMLSGGLRSNTAAVHANVSGRTAANTGTAGAQSNAWNRPSANTGTAGTQSNANVSGQTAANTGTAGAQSNAWNRPSANTGTAGTQSNANVSGQTAANTGTAGAQSNAWNRPSANTGTAGTQPNANVSGQTAANAGTAGAQASKPKSNVPYYMWKFQ